MQGGIVPYSEGGRFPEVRCTPLEGRRDRQLHQAVGDIC